MVLRTEETTSNMVPCSKKKKMRWSRKHFSLAHKQDFRDNKYNE